MNTFQLLLGALVVVLLPVLAQLQVRKPLKCLSEDRKKLDEKFRELGLHLGSYCNDTAWDTIQLVRCAEALLHETQTQNERGHALEWVLTLKQAIDNYRLGWTCLAKVKAAKKFWPRPSFSRKLGTAADALQNAAMTIAGMPVPFLDRLKQAAQAAEAAGKAAGAGMEAAKLAIDAKKAAAVAQEAAELAAQAKERLLQLQQAAERLKTPAGALAASPVA